jgi:hypothetical protein
MLFIALWSVVTAQDVEPGGVWASVSTEKNLTERISVGTEFEFRSSGLSLKRERLGMQISGDYELFNNFKLGTGYSYLNVEDDYRFTNDSIRVHYQNRHRLYLQMSYRFKFGRFNLSLRERAQWTFKDETDRIRIYPGYPPVIGINSNRINPDLVWRNRAKLSYNIPKFPITPSLSFETYYLLNEPEELRVYNNDESDYRTTSAFFSKLRYTLALEYKINKKNSVELFGMLQQERGAEEKVVPGPNYYILSDWANGYVLGLGYNITL